MTEPAAPPLGGQIDAESPPEAEPRRDVSPPLRPRDEHAAFVGELFARFRRPLEAYLRTLLPKREDAADVLQDTYARLLDARDLERTLGRARAYLFRVATNLAFDRFRRRRTRGIEESIEAAALQSVEPTPDQIVGFEQRLAIVRRALLELDPRCREVFLLRASELSYEEIARRLGISKRTVEREMRQALHVCQQKLKGSIDAN